MNYELTNEQKMIQRTLREFSEAEVAPNALERDRSKQFPLDVFKKLSELGVMGLPFPEEYGGFSPPLRFEPETTTWRDGCQPRYQFLAIYYCSFILLNKHRTVFKPIKGMDQKCNQNLLV